jgi:RNA polymerase sigma-70 factor (ECF subfamily)
MPLQTPAPRDTCRSFRTIQAAAGTAQTRLRTVHVMMQTTVDRLAIDRDAGLIEALRVREPAAAEHLLATYDDRAYRLALRITGNREDAEESLQDAFWSVIRKIDTFRGDSSLGSWIYRIVANAAYQKLRGRAHRRDEISLDEVLPLAGIDDPAAQTELRAALNSAIGELPAAYRAVTILREVEGLSMAEVAGPLGITVAAAKSRAHRARLFLRQRLAIFMSGATASIGAPSQEGHLRQPDVIDAHLES